MGRKGSRPLSSGGHHAFQFATDEKPAKLSFSMASGRLAVFVQSQSRHRLEDGILLREMDFYAVLYLCKYDFCCLLSRREHPQTQRVVTARVQKSKPRRFRALPVIYGVHHVDLCWVSLLQLRMTLIVSGVEIWD